MTGFTEYSNYDAMGLAELIANKEVSKKEVFEAAKAHIEKHNPALNAVVHTQFDKAASQIESSTGSLAGVPFLLKDLLGEDAGEPSTASCPPMKDWPAPEDSELVKRFKQGGLTILGRTNTPQLGIYGVTESQFRGPCRNPWNLDHTPGGSSGGSASAVAARMVPIAHAGDGGGSIRIPAAHCGLVGLKGTRGRLPSGPFRGERWNGFVSEGIVSRSVRDTAHVLDLTAGIDVGAPYASPSIPENGFLHAVQLAESAPRRRIAFTKRPLFGTTLDSDNERALMHTVELLQSLGHTVEEACPDYDQERLTYAYYIVVATGVGLGIRQMESKLGRSIKLDELEMSTWALDAISGAFSASEYSEQVDLIHSESRRIAQFFNQYDVLLTPTAAKPPVPIGNFELSATDIMQIRFLRRFPIRSLINKALKALATNAISATPNTMMFNQTGQPAISVPLFWNEQDLPIGSQLVGRFGEEATLLELARQLEIAQPWDHRRPMLLT